MKRGNVYAHTNKFASHKMVELAKKLNTGDLSVLDGIDMPSYIETWQYLEEDTNTIRDVTVIKLGLPAQLELCFYL